MIYLLHGENEFDRQEFLHSLIASLGEYDTLNYVELEGRSLSKEALQHHADVPPFLGDHRLIVVHGLLTRLAGGKTSSKQKTPSSWQQWLVTYLSTVPASTILVFVEDRELPARNAVVRAIVALGENGKVMNFRAPNPRGDELEQWVIAHAKKLGARLERGAAADLASFIGPDLRLIHSELLKLSVYALDRPITRADVRLLTPYAQQANIFAMVDALGNRQTSQAFRLLAQLRNEGAHPLYLLTMIVRQFRLLLQVNDLSGQGMQQDAIAKRLKMKPWMVRKLSSQARRYQQAQLLAIYDRLLDVDAAIKTGQMEANLALDLLVVELARA